MAPTKTRRPTIDAEPIARALAQIGKISSNINRIASHLNAGRPGDRVERALGDVLRDLSECRTVLMQALAPERNRKIKGK
jgi:hypothetical protein